MVTIVQKKSRKQLGDGWVLLLVLFRKQPQRSEEDLPASWVSCFAIVGQDVVPSDCL